MREYVTLSLETHLFFGRIMKEHSLFLLAAFPPSEMNYRRRADRLRAQLEETLAVTVRLSNGNVGEEVLQSGEVVTKYTEMAERQTSRLSGIPIRTQITMAERNLRSGNISVGNRGMIHQVRQLNRRNLQLLDELIRLKENILRDVGDCRLYTTNYPLLVEHILREARLYRDILRELEQTGHIRERDLKETELFWNRIMMEHAQFIRGLLDPTECELMETANHFAEEYRELLEEAGEKEKRCMSEGANTLPEIDLQMWDMKSWNENAGNPMGLPDLHMKSKGSKELTEEYQKFKTAGTEGILGCKIRSIILPLLADHVLREANHYLRLLGEEERA